MIISGTELEYDDVDAKVLDYYLGGDSETKEEWAQRVWNFCKRSSEGEDTASVYKCGEGQTWKERAKELWENKKNSRRQVIKFELNISDSELATVDIHPKYQTRSQREDKIRG